MKDRTLILLGIAFLVLAIGAGVNKSLEACSKVVGAPLAPGITEVYNEQVPNVRETVTKLVQYTEETRSEVSSVMNVLIDKVRTGIITWTQKTVEINNLIKERLSTARGTVALGKK